jgi:hypothetical protein
LVVVLDNAPYHCVQVDKARQQSTLWRVRWYQVFSDTEWHVIPQWGKGPLYELILTKKPRENNIQNWQALECI